MTTDLSRERFGDWEIDTVLGQHETGSIVTRLERKTLVLFDKESQFEPAADVTKATIELLMPYKAHVLTITADNGRKFAHHQEIAEVLDTQVYLAHPYCSCE